MSKNVTADDKDVQWVWHEVNALRNNVKIPFTGPSGAQKDFVSVLDTFLLFFDEEVIAVIVAETNKCAEQYIQKCTLKPRSRVRKWEPVTGEEIYVALGLMMLMGIVETPTIKSYFSKDPFLETPIFYQTMTQDRFELITHAFISRTIAQEIHTQDHPNCSKFNPYWNYKIINFKVLIYLLRILPLVSH
jgi:hypothetical protein